MRIHSNTLTSEQVWKASHDLPGVYVHVSEHGSRSHERAFEVRMEGNGYARNTGKYGADQYETGATWDEWGVFLARLFNLDANALSGSVKYPTYANAADFHRQTFNRFASLSMPEDTHKRHNFKYAGPGSRTWECSKCSAKRIY